jgi:hypothetical protein
MKSRILIAALAACTLPVMAQDAPVPADFSWRARLEVPAGANVARLPLPADALARLQSSDARDVRVFNAAGQAVGYAITRPAAPAVEAQQTRNFGAYPLFATAPGGKPAKGSVQVKVNDASGQQVWVQLGGDAAVAQKSASQPLNAAIFTTKDEKQTITAITVHGEVPANTPIEMTLSASPDLAQWTGVPLRGRLFRFDGDAAPRNMTLPLGEPLRLEGRYLRLEWHGQAGVKVTGITGTLASAGAPADRVRAKLAAPTQAGPGALEWQLPFATPVAALAVSPRNANTIAPVRLLGRNDAAQPWLQIGQGVVYKVGDNVNPPLPLNGASVRSLRLETTQGAPLDAGALDVSAEFLPVQVAFLVSGEGPFELAVGRARTAAAAIGPDMLVAASGKKADELPLAKVIEVLPAGTGSGSVLDKFIPGEKGRSAVLWGVLLAGVLLLGAVAWTLLRQLKAPAP